MRGLDKKIEGINVSKTSTSSASIEIDAVTPTVLSGLNLASSRVNLESMLMFILKFMQNGK